MDRIRKAVLSDMPALKSVYQDFVLAMNEFDPSDANLDDEILMWIEDALLKDRSSIFVVGEGGEVDGFARVSHKQRMSNDKRESLDYAKLSDLYVRPQVRRRGIAGRLIQASADWAGQRGISEMTLHVYEKNTAARTLYQSLGFWEDCVIGGGRIRMKASLQGDLGSLLCPRGETVS